MGVRVEGRMKNLSLGKTQWVGRRGVGCVKIEEEDRGRGIGISMGKGIYFEESCYVSISNFKENMMHISSNELY